jgi:hypothetical protein
VAASDEVLSWRDVAEAVGRAGGCQVTWISADQADRAGLDTATMSIANVVRDGSAQRRLGWRATSSELGVDVLAAAR